MNNIAGIPYSTAEFDQNGRSVARSSVPGATTDVIIISHGWNNNRAAAEGLYRKLFTNFVAVAPLESLAPRKLALVGVIWPSKRFDELIAVAGKSAPAGGAASLSDDSDLEGAQKIKQGLENLKALFPDAAGKIGQAEALVADLEEKGSARAEFLNIIRALLDPSEANDEDASNVFFAADPETLFKRFAIPVAALRGELADRRPAASLDASDDGPRAARGGAAGITDIFSNIGSAVTNLLNYTTYYAMKQRAGNVGRKGVAPLIDHLADAVEWIHLVGHSFGGRLVTAAAMASKTKKLRSMTLLQAAFSHNGFSPTWPGFFRSVGSDRRVKGPILITYTKNDKAVGLAYPLASRINGDTAAAFGDENDQFGGIGRNGAQQMPANDVIKTELRAVNSSYTFQPGKFYNLEASAFIPDHGTVSGPEVAWALSRAIL